MSTESGQLFIIGQSCGHEPAESLRVDEVEGVAADLKLRVGERLTAVLGTQSETWQAA